VRPVLTTVKLAQGGLVVRPLTVVGNRPLESPVVAAMNGSASLRRIRPAGQTPKFQEHGTVGRRTPGQVLLCMYGVHR